jgi:hypothetical protein
VQNNAQCATPLALQLRFTSGDTRRHGCQRGAGNLHIALCDAPRGLRVCAGALGPRIAAAGRCRYCRGATVTRHHRAHVRSQGGVSGCVFYRAPLWRQGSVAIAKRARRARDALRADLVLLSTALTLRRSTCSRSLQQSARASAATSGSRCRSCGTPFAAMGLSTEVPGALRVDRHHPGGGREPRARLASPLPGSERRLLAARPLRRGVERVRSADDWGSAVFNRLRTCRCI